LERPSIPEKTHPGYLPKGLALHKKFPSIPIDRSYHDLARTRRDWGGAVGIANFNDSPTETFTISGTATQSKTLTAAKTLAGLDGPGVSRYHKQADENTIPG